MLLIKVISQVYMTNNKSKNLFDLNMAQRTSQIAIIKRNRDLGIMAPFDSYAIFRFILNNIPSKACKMKNKALQLLATEISMKTGNYYKEW